MERSTITRQELYDLVWKESITSIAKKYALTSRGLKSICENNKIPLPQNGYWSKVKFNKPVVIEKLPEDSSVSQLIELTSSEKEDTISYERSPYTILIQEIENDSNAPVIVSDNLTKPDILIQNTQEIYRKQKKERFYRDDKVDYVAINVDDANLARALRIMDAFIKLLRYRGHSFRRDRNNFGPHIVIKDVEFSFYLREVQKRIPADKLHYSSTYLPTGKLVLKIGQSITAVEWKDGSVKLENQLVKIVAKLELLAEKEILWREECRIRSIQRAEEERIKKEFLARKDIEILKVKKLFSDAEKFEKATVYRRFIKATEQKAIEENNVTDELKDWIKWANEKADWFDPFTKREDELLNENDREELHKPKQQNNYYR
jgi:hypothetical protein